MTHLDLGRRPITSSVGSRAPGRTVTRSSADSKGVTSAYLPLGGIMVGRQVQNAINEAPADLKFMHCNLEGKRVCRPNS